MEATDHSVNPDEILEEMLARASRSDKRETLRKLHQICSSEYSRRNSNARDLSLANISRLAQLQGLFRARTIYNKQSADYAALVSAWQSFSGQRPSGNKKHGMASCEKHAFLANIDDPAIRNLCQIALLERDKFRAELNMLKGKTQVIIDMRSSPAVLAEASSNLKTSDSTVQLTDSERNALSAAIDSKKLAKRKWRLGDTGEILDEYERFIFNPGFASGIAKILGYAS